MEEKENKIAEPGNNTPFLGKLSGILCILLAFCDFILMFMTDTYDRSAVLGGILIAVCGYLIYRQDLIYPALKKAVSPKEQQSLPFAFSLCWTLLFLLIAGSLAAWVWFSTPLLPRFFQMFGLK